MATQGPRKKQRTSATGLGERQHEDEVAVITGGARGLGLAIATRLLEKGAKVVLLDLNETALKDTVTGLQAQGLSSVSFKALDVSDEKQVTLAFAAVHQEHSRIDILVQSAGITGKTGIKTHEVDPAGPAALPHSILGNGAQYCFPSAEQILIGFCLSTPRPSFCAAAPSSRSCCTGITGESSTSPALLARRGTLECLRVR